MANAPTPKGALKKDLEEIEARLTALEAVQGRTGALFFLDGEPEAALGIDGDGAINEGNGGLFLKVEGAWSLRGNLWLDRADVAA